MDNIERRQMTTHAGRVALVTGAGQGIGQAIALALADRGGEQMIHLNDQKKIEMARNYFVLADQGNPAVLELLHEEVEIYFPKFGFGTGRQSLLEMVKGFEGSLESIQHDYKDLQFTPADDSLIVEGTSHGKLSDRSWAGGKTPGGRFCNVFKFRDGLIASLHIYLDPDYTGEDEKRFRWGKNRKW